MKKFNKNIAKEFKTGFGRFIAIMAIVALGVGFLIGVMQATPDMKNSMDTYLVDNLAYDVDIKGTFGLTETDLEVLKRLPLTDTDVAELKELGVNGEAIEKLKEVEGVVDDVTPVVSTDVAVTVNGAEIVGRIVGIENLSGGEYLNTLTLSEGKWPSGAGEVVVARSTHYFEDIKVGDEIFLPETISFSNATYGDVYVAKMLKVTGVVASPDYYYQDAREITTLGAGFVGAVIYGETGDLYDLQKSGSVFSYFNDAGMMGYLGLDTIEVRYTDFYVKIKGSEQYGRFTDRYKSYVLEQSAALKEVGAVQSGAIRSVLENETVSGFLQSMGLAFTEAQWMILDRASSNPSYISFEMNVEKVENIAGVFPIFFIFVAGLVALTSMTRMVEEDRMQIGTFKALGYGNARIMSKYLIYCCLASLIGCIAGILLGFSLLPSIFWQAYATMYTLPSLLLSFSPWIALAVFAVALSGTVLVTWAACRAFLKEKPSKLMQPKAPKAGKRVALERIGFIWNHLKFKWKATIRNIFRYKRNMILTIVSVMGCTALILTGFGLNDSVVAVTDLQYNKIIQYDTVIEYSGDLEEIQEGALRDFLTQSENAGGYLSLYGESGTLVFDGAKSGREGVSLYLVENTDEFASFVSLHEHGNSAIIDITEGGVGSVVIPENIATVYGIRKGDTVRYLSGTVQKQLTVYAICENYTGAYVYMSRASYAELFSSDIEFTNNTLFVRSGIAEATADDTAKTLLSDANVTSVAFIYSSIDTFEGLEQTMGLVIAVLVLCAGALAAIVLYNLTNINIEERRREIATLRVLGYRKWEVVGYIYRESAILTVVGALLGLGLGVLLHLFIASRANSVMMMFGRAICGWSYLWAFLLTVAFAVIVYAFMLIKLNRIDMAESLKSNE